MHPKTVGERTEAIVLAELIKAGYVVLLPFGDNQRYDFVIDTHVGFKRVQAKTGRLQSGSIVFQACSARMNTKKTYRTDYRGQADLFAVFCPETERVYMVPVDTVGTVEAHLRVEKNGAVKRSRWAKDYELAPEVYGERGVL